MDEKTYKYSSFEIRRARIVQGILIYAVMLALLGLGLFSGETKLVMAILLVLALAYASLFTYNWRTQRNVKDAVVLALLKLIAAPTSMLG